MANLSQARRRSEIVAAPAVDAGGTLRSMRVYPAFRLLLLGTLSTNSAFWMYQVSVGWLALQMTDSALFVGLAGFVGGIPLLLFSLPAGVMIDRVDRRAVLFAAQSGVMVVAGLYAILVGTDVIAPWSLLLLAAANGTVMSFIFPVRTAIVPSLVRRDDLANAIALSAASQNATRVLGPSLAGVLIAAIGVSGTFAVAAVMQILALWATARLPSSAAVATSRGGTGWGGLTFGLRIVARDPFLASLILMALAPTVLVMPYLNLMPVFARDELGVGSSGLGMLLASTGLGTVAGALSVARSPRLRTWSGAQAATAVGFAALVLAFALMPNILPAMLLLFAAGWASAAYLAMNQTALQLRVDDDVRGRVLSIYLMTWGTLPLGQLAIGALASRLGAPLAVACACSFAIAGIAYIARRSLALRA